ncbi:putative O-linked N-acetylglucosamine transferase (SPINDLY family) [Acidovorax sp. 56]|uniref:tetratricopeptide repeat protein n=1 Tax=Acidovorax sp. 56 TaxID=2035205 RepID=UPI000C17173C|nr:tetratricopeptide repeat protein [Acidovorax sp. 56]PIF27483.1 putative O-linked N-acetylglucosamine transferase (SPINDLY family) [Acidovorax sp. 56]
MQATPSTDASVATFASESDGQASAQASNPVQALLVQTMALALDCHRAQNLAQAEELYRAVLSLAPDHADANHNLGAIAMECGQFLAAVPFFQAALQANPKNRQYWVSLVDALIQAGEHTLAEDILEDARRAGLAGDAAGELVERLVDAVMRRTRSARPPQGRMASADQVAELNRLFEAEKFDDVLRLGRKMTRQYPQCPMGFKSLSAALMQLGQMDKAVAPMRQALQLNPRDVDMLSNYGLARSLKGDLVQAEVLLRQAVGHAPRFPQGWFNLAIVLRGQARLQASEQAYRQALEVGGDDPKVLLNLGLLLGEMHRFTEGQACVRRALALDPNMVHAHVGLGMLLKDQGRLPEALQALQRALELSPADPGVHSSYLFVANCMPEIDPLERFAAYQRFNQYFGEPHRSAWRPHTNDRNPERRLRVGYVAPVFRTHACRPFLEPLLERHDHDRVELFAYAGPFELEDEVTDHYRTLFEHWIDTRQMSDDELAARIRADGIDVLVDIAGQTKGHRLGGFARKPAPVSLHWLDSGYTTGLTAIDYYLTDAMTVPEGSEHLFSETPWRLPRAPFAYRPGGQAGDVSELPALANGYVTFGTLTRAVRLNDRVVRAWAALLHRVPGSRLELNSGNFCQAEVREQWWPRFEALGIPRDRVIMGFESPPWNVLRRVDIALDCFPQNSGTTLIESLYMGLPFVSLAGVPSMGTLGASVLSAVGHPEWIARSEAEYVDKLVALASDLPSLAQTRRTLRAQMQASALMDEAGFARDVEDAYAQMFARWCAKQG